MKQLLLFLLIAFFGSCSRHELAASPLAEQALKVASIKCRNALTLEWLRHLIEQSEVDIQLKGSIYAIQYSTGVVFLHQPWISSCFGCRLYDCEGSPIKVTEGERNEIIAGISEDNLIYTSTK